VALDKPRGAEGAARVEALGEGRGIDHETLKLARDAGELALIASRPRFRAGTPSGPLVAVGRMAAVALAAMTRLAAVAVETTRGPS
jgi:hypothetical protein